MKRNDRWSLPLLIEAADSAHPQPMAAIVAVLFLLGCAASLGASAAYHRCSWWSRRTERLAIRMDFLGIYCLISGVFSPVYGLLLPPPVNVRSLVVQWLAAGLGMLISARRTNNRWLRVLPFLVAVNAGLLVSYDQWKPQDRDSGHSLNCFRFPPLLFAQLISCHSSSLLFCSDFHLYVYFRSF